MTNLNEAKLVIGRQPVLMEPAEPFDFAAPPCDPHELTEKMLEVMNDNNGYGLSACQLGLPYAVFVMAGDIVCFNPRMVSVSEETIELEEGCLSFPGATALIARPRHVRLRFTSPNGATETRQFTGISARVVQHEMDHLNGILFFNHLPRIHREKLIKQFQKGMKNEKSQITTQSSFFAPLEHAARILQQERAVRNKARTG